MERYLGIDMHRDSCTAVVLSAGGKKTGQQVVPTEAAALVQYVKSLSGELHVCVEEGEWSEWVSRSARKGDTHPLDGRSPVPPKF